MTDNEERRIYDGSQRMSDALSQLRALRESVDGRTPLSDAANALDGIEDEIASIEKKVSRALAILDAEITRIETLPDLEYVA